MGNCREILDITNIVYNMDYYQYITTIPDKKFDFIFIDPPYFRVKGDFDFKLTFDEWIELHQKLARECYRILSDRGSIILWGHALKIAYQQHYQGTEIDKKYFAAQNERYKYYIADQ